MLSHAARAAGWLGPSSVPSAKPSFSGAGRGKVRPSHAQLGLPGADGGLGAEEEAAH